MSRQRTRASTPRKAEPANPLDHAKGHEVIWQQVCDVFDAARRIEGWVSYVYFIGEQDDGPVKIGVAKDPLKRLRSMQTGNPRRLKLEHVLIGDMPVEKVIHEMWERFAIRSVAVAKAGKFDAAPGTEWFEPEIREMLFPVIAEASDKQSLWVHETEGDLAMVDLVRIIHEAHGSHGIVAQKRDEVRLLGTGGAYAYPGRRSRL